MNNKDSMVIAFYMFIALVSWLSITFEPMYGDLIAFCLVLHIFFVAPVMAIVKGYIK